MGVNKDEEDSVLTEQSGLIIEETVVEPQPPVLPRKTKHRQSQHFCHRLMPKSAGNKTGGHKRTRRYENTCFLMSLVEDNDFGEVTISDFVESSQSVFEKLLSDRDSLEIWNDFMNRPEDEQEIFLQQVVTKEGARKEEVTKEEGETTMATTTTTEDAPEDNKEIEDKRTVHPAHTPEKSFLRINSRLRAMLRRKHLPRGMLKSHEDDLVPWFTDDPGAVFISHIHCSYDRLLLHAVCQYLDLQSISYDCNNQRHTKVENSQDYFRPPELLLSQYLDSLAS